MQFKFSYKSILLLQIFAKEVFWIICLYRKKRLWQKNIKSVHFKILLTCKSLCWWVHEVLLACSMDLLCRNLKQNKISRGPCKSQLEPVLFRHFNKSFDPLAQFPKFCTTEEQIWNTGYLRYGSSALILYKELSSFSIFQSLWVSHWVRHR